MKTSGSIAVTDNDIVQKIYIVRGIKVMLDKDLAEMYGVPTSRLNEAVKRNIPGFQRILCFKLQAESSPT